MATEWISPTWRMPENSNQNKVDNYSLEFDGSLDFINCGTSSLFDFGTSDFAWSFWINYETHVNYAGLLYTGITNNEYRLKFQTSGQIYFYKMVTEISSC